MCRSWFTFPFGVIGRLFSIIMILPGHCFTISDLSRMVNTSWQKRICITKTYLYNVDPLKPHFYIVKLGFTGYTLLFLFLLKNIDCGYSLEPPPRGGSNGYPQSMFWAEMWKISEFYQKIFSFLVVKFSVYLIRLVFVMGYFAFNCFHYENMPIQI